MEEENEKIKELKKHEDDIKLEEEKELKRIQKICEITTENYINMKKRLSIKDKFSKFILTYYSIFLIFLGVSGNYIKTYDKTLSDYTGILLSIILLAYSLVNSNSCYEIRVYKLEKIINELRRLRRKKSITSEEFAKNYDSIIINGEMREDRDFYITVKELYKKRGEKKITFLINGNVLQGNENLKKYRDQLSITRNFIQNGFEFIQKLVILSIPIILILRIIQKVEN